MKIQLLNGGLANEVFQYIFARHYELLHPGQIMYLDDSFFDLVKAHNGYELEKVFGLKPHFLRECFDEDVWKYILQERKLGKSMPRILNENGMEITMVTESDKKEVMFSHDKDIKYVPSLQELNGNIYYHGYWLAKEWFERYKNIFLQELRFPIIKDNKNKEYENKIISGNSVSIHIRRGDYVDLGIGGTANEYRVCVENFKENARLYPNISSVVIERDIAKWNLFVFSDDILWCKNNAHEMGFDSFGEVVFVEGNMNGNNYKDLYLMSLCEGMIMSNSAFCYLAVLLNTRKKIVLNLTGREI